MSKLISWNIAGRLKARSAQLKWIVSEEADILAFQEVVSASDLRQRLSALGFKYFASTEPVDGRKKLVAIASRKPIGVISTFAVPHPERAISCRISLGSKEAELHCIHVCGKRTVKSQAASIARRRLQLPAGYGAQGGDMGAKARNGWAVATSKVLQGC